MKNILVLTDFSEMAKSAAKYAMSMAATFKANIILCHALEITEQLTYPLADHLVLRNQAMKRLKEVGIHLNETKTSTEDFQPSISYINDLDMLPEVVDKVLKANTIDLVVIGSQKSGNLSRFFFGSHTDDILDNISCPVLLIPKDAVFEPLQHIFYATDLTFDNKKVIKYLSKLAKPFDATISVNHISPLDLPLSEDDLVTHYPMEQNTESPDSKVFYTTIKGENIPESLKEVTGRRNVNVLALVHKRYDFFEGLFHNSVSKKLAQSTTVPLLVLPYSFSFASLKGAY